MSDGASPEIGTRRERARADTLREIRATARAVLGMVEELDARRSQGQDDAVPEAALPGGP